MRKKTDSILQSAVIERKQMIMPNPAREMDVVSEKQVKCLCTSIQAMDQKRKSGILIAGAKCEEICCRNNRKCNQDQNMTVFGKG